MTRQLKEFALGAMAIDRGPCLACGTLAELDHIELSPFGIHGARFGRGLVLSRLARARLGATEVRAAAIIQTLDSLHLNYPSWV